MSLRERCLEMADKIIEEGFVEVSTLEAFAKQEQIKGMETVKAILQAHHSRVWITEQIDAAIAKLKEGGHD